MLLKYGNRLFEEKIYLNEGKLWVFCLVCLSCILVVSLSYCQISRLNVHYTRIIHCVAMFDLWELLNIVGPDEVSAWLSIFSADCEISDQNVASKHLRGKDRMYAGIFRHCVLIFQISCKCNIKLECGPMPNLMVALPNIGGALCSTPQSLADAHY